MLSPNSADVLIGSATTNALHGLAGKDTLVGGEGGADVLKARDGVRGNDSLDGGPGTDICGKDPGDLALNCP